MKGHRIEDVTGVGAGRDVEAVARPRRLPAPLRMAGTLVACCIVLLLVGFALFATHVSRLSAPRNPQSADGIIVLTGGQARLDAAVSLLKSGKGKRLLISGVHPSTTRKTLQAATGADDALFSCCVDIDREALDTVGNAEESAKWVHSNAYDRVILVTNNYHMPRSLLEMQRLLDTEELEPYPVVNSAIDKGSWIARPEVLRVLFTEYGKYLLALARGAFPTHLPDTSMISANASPGEH
ncbi:MAG: YdcF family protein [Mesorhizobium sp.]|nr:YdcF family protein [Mesorhizobium sp.]